MSAATWTQLTADGLWESKEDHDQDTLEAHLCWQSLTTAREITDCQPLTHQCFPSHLMVMCTVRRYQHRQTECEIITAWLNCPQGAQASYTSCLQP